MLVEERSGGASERASDGASERLSDGAADQPVPERERVALIYNALVQNLAREDSNSHNRVMWALSLTSGQFIAISFLMTRIGNSGEWAAIALLGALMLSGLGVFFCLRTRRGLEAAHAQIDYLKNAYKSRKPVFDAFDLPRPFGELETGKVEKPGQLDPGRRSCSTYVQALLIVWTLTFLACVAGLMWVGQTHGYSM